MSTLKLLPFFASIPHSGEQVPDEVFWLKGLQEPKLMRDVDRYVDFLYKPVLNQLKISTIITPWHRYVVDLNRKPDEYDATAVKGAPHPKGTHPKGLHWSQTTLAETLISEPMEAMLHEDLVKSYYKPFHDSVLELRASFKQQFGCAYHLDLHSMPSLGTELHPDPGETRADVVISDQHAKSSEPWFRDLVLKAYQEAGFQVAYNWPYIGGGITATYGDPEKSFHTVQVELNRALYMNEETKKLEEGLWPEAQEKLTQAMTQIHSGIREKFNV